MALAYLKDCEICNVGLCKRGAELLDSGMTLNKAAKIISVEITNDLGHYLYSPSAIRNRIQLHTGKKDPHKAAKDKKAAHSEQPSSKAKVAAAEAAEDAARKKKVDAAAKSFQEECDKEEAEFDEFCAAYTTLSNPFPDALKPMLLELIKYGYRSLAIKYHPDKPGGSADAMSKLNSVRDLLLIMAN